MSNSIDHRQIAGEMEIYFLSEEIGAGLPVWLPNGVAIRDALESFVRDLERKAGYQRVVSPHLGRSLLYEKSGHLEFYRNDMYPPMQLEKKGQDYYLKPMNCPHHHLVFGSSPRSYRDLPLRLAEYGQVYRYEPSGGLRGLSRVRGLCQNDAHIYVAPEQALDEVRSVLRLHEACYRALGLKRYRYRLSKRSFERPNDFPGDSRLWERCEDILREALSLEGLSWFEAEGEAAFYGPKIDVQMPVAGSCEESMASLQLDLLSGERFDLSFIDPSGAAVRPWVIHRAPLGSHERFVAMLLEEYDGRLPGWLAPVQLVMIPVSDREFGVCEKLLRQFQESGLKVKVDHSSGSLSKRVRAAHRQRPFAKIIVGEKEASSGLYELKLRDGSLQGSIGALVEQLDALCCAPIVKS